MLEPGGIGSRLLGRLLRLTRQVCQRVVAPEVLQREGVDKREAVHQKRLRLTSAGRGDRLIWWRRHVGVRRGCRRCRQLRRRLIGAELFEDDDQHGSVRPLARESSAVPAHLPVASIRCVRTEHQRERHDVGKHLHLPG